MAGNPTLPTENIDEVILRLLALEPNEIDELDYETYKSYLKELLVEVTASKRKIGDDEFNSIKNEFKRIRGKKGRFKIKKTKISATGLGLGGIRKQIKGTQKRLMLAPVGGVPKSQEKIETISKKTKENPLLKISETLDSILSTLIDIGKQDIKEREKNRRSEEEKKRKGRETDLESKTFDGLKKAISAITKPFQSIWDKIVNFIFYTFLGRVVVKLFDWFGDPKNQDKVKSLIRFVKDWWPALLGSYILFGTKFGGLIRFVGGWAVKLAFQLGKVVIPKLLTFIAKNPFAALAVAGGVGAYAATQQNKERRDEFAKTDPSIVKPEETAKTGKGPGVAQLSQEQIGQQGLGLGFSGGGAVRYPRFSGGGFNFGGMMGGASMGSMFGPLGMLLGGALGSGKPQEMASGFVSGPGGPKGDKIPAMLSDGEFVMSAGAVQKYGVDTLESMNAAGGGTNKPEVVSGKTYAAGGGYIGKSNESFSKNPLGSIVRFLKYKFGVDVDNKSSWGSPSPLPKFSQPNVSTGSLITDPMGALSRIGTNVKMPSLPGGVKMPSLPGGVKMPSLPGGVKMPSLPGGVKMPSLPGGVKMPSLPGGVKMPSLPGGVKMPSLPGGVKMPSLPGGVKMPSLPGSKKDGFLDNLKSATYRDAGAIYAKQMFGGFGGPVSERDLSKESQAELQKAIQRAKKRTGSEIRKVESEIEKLKGMGAKDGNPALERQKSFLEKLKKGGIRVQYTDYADEKGQMSESAKNAKNILGQFWAYGRDKKEGGGYRVEDKYDFDMFKKNVKDPKTGKMTERDFTGSELWSEGVLGKDKTIQQRLQAAYLLNPLRGKGDVNMVLGGNRSTEDSMNLTLQKTLASGGLGAALVSGAFRANKPKDKNTQALESKRPWWDKMGMFGGASAQMEKDKKAKKLFEKKNPGAKLYNKPQKNTKQPYKSKFSRPENAGKPPVKPSPKPTPKVTVAGGAGGKRRSRVNPSSKQKAPSPSPKHPKNGTASKPTYGIK